MRISRTDIAILRLIRLGSPTSELVIRLWPSSRQPFKKINTVRRYLKALSKAGLIGGPLAGPHVTLAGIKELACR